MTLEEGRDIYWIFLFFQQKENSTVVFWCNLVGGCRYLGQQDDSFLGFWVCQYSEGGALRHIVTQAVVHAGVGANVAIQRSDPAHGGAHRGVLGDHEGVHVCGDELERRRDSEG